MTKYNLTRESLEDILQESNAAYTSASLSFSILTTSIFGGDGDETETEIVKTDGDIVIAISGNESKFVDVMYCVDGNPIGITAVIDDIYGYVFDNGKLTISIVTYDDTYCDIIFENATEITEDQTL